MKILTQQNMGMKGFHGYIGDQTNMFDSFGEPLYVGDIVIVSNQDKFAKQNHYLGNEYGIAFVCEEVYEIVNWTNKNQQYIMGIADIWNNNVFAENHINFDDDYWENLINLMGGWIVHKIKDHSKLAIGECIEFIYVEEVQ